jgi:hypothetical protein
MKNVDGIAQLALYRWHVCRCDWILDVVQIELGKPVLI